VKTEFLPRCLVSLSWCAGTEKELLLICVSSHPVFLRGKGLKRKKGLLLRCLVSSLHFFTAGSEN
jgi:hypothetical protein